MSDYNACKIQRDMNQPKHIPTLTHTFSLYLSFVSSFFKGGERSILFFLPFPPLLFLVSVWMNGFEGILSSNNSS